ncbi:IS200/IS605 family accessory protein TnpB-related protein, partial [Spirulina sp. 06S082]|uniref:IS200/IS605 family accessory protein TnpB-related protein n=1 Tax=Spirulina sp. 06S082 TaxID=3110248 RepID=UPI002B1EF22D
GERKHRFCQPPKLTAMCKSYPSLYKGQQIRYGEKYRTIQIKIWNGKDWVWSAEIPVKKQGKNRHLVEGNEIKSPALVVNKRTCQLSLPVKIKKVEREESEYVCSVDLGINNAATAAIVGADGTVKARKFINPARDIDRRNRRRMKIAKKAKQTARIIGQKHSKRCDPAEVSNSSRDATRTAKERAPRKGFCKGLYRKSSHINREISRKVMREIVEFAKANNVKVIVFENLAGWKAKAGRKGTLHKQKFHLWCHRKIVELTQERWRELGGNVVFINPKYTSAYAFDGSGKVKRGKNNYSLCRSLAWLDMLRKPQHPPSASVQGSNTMRI